LRAFLSACPGARRGAKGASAAGQGSNPLKTKRLLRQKALRNDCNFIPKRVYMRALQCISGIVVASSMLAASVFSQNIAVGQTAPGFTLDRYGGGVISLTDFPHKTIFLNFFGST
jgi:hypothetical protein